MIRETVTNILGQVLQRVYKALKTSRTRLRIQQEVTHAKLTPSHPRSLSPDSSLFAELQVERALETFDANGNGQLEFAEFVTMYAASKEFHFNKPGLARPLSASAFSGALNLLCMEQVFLVPQALR